LVGLILIIFTVMCRSWVQIALATYLPEWLHDQGQSLVVGGQILSLFLVTIGAGSLVGGNLSDRLGSWQVVAAGMGLLGPALWFFVNTTGLLQVGLAAFLGFLIGLSMPVGVVMAQETWPRGVGLASALVMGLGWAPGGMGASFTGLMADHFTLTLGLQLLVIPPLLGLVSILVYAARQRQSGRLARRSGQG